MKIVETPNPILTQKAKPVKKINSSLRRIIKNMQKLLKESKIGVGLAAPQVGLPLKLFIAAPNLANPKKRKKAKYYVFINPILTQTKGPKDQRTKGQQVRFQTSDLRSPISDLRSPNLEGCLSIPNVWGKVKRSPRAQVSYTDENGNVRKKTFTGLMATIIQHEMDHLNGTLFTSHVLSQRYRLYEQVKNEETGKMEMREIEI